MTKTQSERIKELVTEINESYKRLGKERDKLRDLIDEAEGILDDVDDAQSLIAEAVQNLEEAADSISKMV